MTHYLSWWERSVLLRPFDFAVLGAGLLGKQIAIRIQAQYPSARIALVDRSPVSYGASTRNAGFACFGSISEILDDFHRSSERDVIALAEKRYRGISELVATFGAGAIDYKQCGGHEIFTDRGDLELAKDKLSYINKLLSAQLGVGPVFSLRSSASAGMRCEEECIFNPYEGMLNSGLLNEVISDIAHRAGIVPLYGLDIQSLHSSQDGYTLLASNGMEVLCSQLILANNAFAAPFLPDEDIQPARGQVLITKPLEKLPFKGIFFSDKGYNYFRTVDKRVLIGGGRHLFREQERTYAFGGSENVREFLENYLREVVLPGLDFETDMHWSGIMAMGAEKMPIVRRVNDHLVICVRMSGMGVALGPVLSREVMELLS